MVQHTAAQYFSQEDGTVVGPRHSVKNQLAALVCHISADGIGETVPCCLSCLLACLLMASR
jgi:hypothetical protein